MKLFLRIGLFATIALFTLSACTDTGSDTAATQQDPETAIPTTTERTAVSSSERLTTTTTTEPTDPLAVHISPSGDDRAAGTASAPFASLSQALTVVAPTGTIYLQSGTYDPLVIDAATDITLASLDPDTVNIVGADFGRGPGILVTNSSGVTLTGLRISTVLWGVWIEASTDIVVRTNVIEELGQEGIMVKRNSSEVLIEDNVIRSTGQRPGESRGRPYSTFGEGIYIGNAGPLDDGTRDQSNNVTIRNNQIYNTTAEAIDIKSWADDILIEGNLIYDVDTATSGAIVVGIGSAVSPSNNITIQGNVIHSVTRTSTFDHGNAIVVSSPATVVGNVIWDVEHYGILIDRRLGSSAGGDVVIEGNLILNSGLDSIAQLSTSPDVNVTIEENLTGQAAQDLLGTTPTVADGWAAVASLTVS